MILYPAIDLKDGKCVRLLKGDMKKATVFNDSPAKQAKEFYDAGCEWLHIVDLDGAMAGESVNGNAVRDILQACPNMNIQLGGGIRTMEMVEYWLALGISRVILGTAAVTKPDLTREAIKKFPRRIVLGIDAIDGYVATDGWTKTTPYQAEVLARMYRKERIAAIIYTDISRDGAMQGPNVEATAAMAKAVTFYNHPDIPDNVAYFVAFSEHQTTIPVIASGGVSSLDDLRTLKHCGAELDGVISGRAIYDKKIDVKEALALLKD